MKSFRKHPGQDGRWQWFIVPLHPDAHAMGIHRWDLSDRMTLAQADSWRETIAEDHGLPSSAFTLRAIR